MATSNYTKLSLHKQAYELIEAIIRKEEQLTELKDRRYKIIARVDNSHKMYTIDGTYNRIHACERLLGFLNARYAVLSGKICQESLEANKPKQWDNKKLYDLLDSFEHTPNVILYNCGPGFFPAMRNAANNMLERQAEQTEYIIPGWPYQDKAGEGFVPEHVPGLVEPVDVPYMDPITNAGYY